MSRLLFTCAYDGTPYLGWQSQRGGGTIQDTIESAFAAILHTPLRIAAAGRTDAGVHAHGQCFHADVPSSSRMSALNWRAALNANLPSSIRILDVREVPASFHARFDATGKVYEYLISRESVLSPFLARRVWHLPHDWDARVLAEALRSYVGKHDFRRLAARRGNEPADPPAGYYHRTIYSAELMEEGSLIRLRFRGDGFMYRMVRLLVGSAHQVARGRLSIDALRQYMEQPEGPTSRFCAPADGLYLMKVEYSKNPLAETGTAHPEPKAPQERQ